VWTLESQLPVPCWRRRDSAAGVRLGFSTRRGGVSPPPYDSLNLGRSTADRPESVVENRARFLRQLGADPSRLVTVGQVHGPGVAVATAPGFHPERDAVVSQVPGLILAVSSADCLPILLVARGREGPAVAAVHAGWRGSADGIALAALRVLNEQLGAGAAMLTAHLGPCIRQCCYQVGPEVAARFSPDHVATRGGSRYLDFPAAIRRQLIEAGVPPGSIEDTGACTACEPHWYFSHRRDRGITGRHWGVIGLDALPA